MKYTTHQRRIFGAIWGARLGYLVGALLVAALLVSLARKPSSRPGSAETKTVVEQCLQRVRANIGGWCGTPEVEAHQQLTDIGKPVVPILTSALKEEKVLEVKRFILDVLASVCCKSFNRGQSHDALVKEIEAWWKANGRLDQQEWIMAALKSGNREEFSLASLNRKKITDKRFVPKLVSLLDSPKRDVRAFALYTLWDNFKSKEALKYVRRASAHGTIETKRMVLTFVGDRHVMELSSVVCEILKAEQDHSVFTAALDTVRKIGTSECLATIEEMDRTSESKYPKSYVIRALATLKGSAYGERVLYYLENGADHERVAAASVLNKCVSAETAAAPLLTALKDAHIDVRRHACLALGQVGSDKNSRRQLQIIVPGLICLFDHKDDSDLGSLADRSLRKIAAVHFKSASTPRVDESLGGSRFSKHASPLWQEWWNQNKQNLSEEK